MQQLTALGAYIFAGGFTIGVEKSFEVLAHFEESDYGVATFKKNRPHIPVHVKPETWPIKDFKNRVDFIYCNPPCALFSVAGASLLKGIDNWKTDPRRSCWERCFNLFEQLEPVVIAIESVPLALKRGREMLDQFSEHAHRKGYAVTHLLEDARWHGLPQKRPRYMFMAHKVSLQLEAHNWAPPGTVMETIGHLENNPGHYNSIASHLAPIIENLPPGANLRAAWEAANPPETWTRGLNGVKGRPRFCDHRMLPNGLGGAYIGDFFIHPTQNRKLSVEEAKALCGFPPEWRFYNDRHAPSEIARGVMPPVAAWLARSVADSIRRGAPVAPGVSTVDLRQPPAD